MTTAPATASSTGSSAFSISLPKYRSKAKAKAKAVARCSCKSNRKKPRGASREEIEESVERLAILLDLNDPKEQPAGQEGFMSMAVTHEMFAIDEAYSPLRNKRGPPVSTNPVWSCFAARYLLRTVEAFLICPTPCSDFAATLHACERTIYWSKFTETGDGCAELVTTQARRMAHWPFDVNKPSDGTWFLSGCSFLSVLLCWSPRAPSVVIGHVLQRALTCRIRALLHQPGFGSDGHALFSHPYDRPLLERLLAYLGLHEPLGRDAIGFGKEGYCCHRKACGRELGDRMGPMYACGRCRCVLWCSDAHQREGWARHRPHCYPTALTGTAEEEDPPAGLDPDQAQEEIAGIVRKWTKDQCQTHGPLCDAGDCRRFSEEEDYTEEGTASSLD